MARSLYRRLCSRARHSVRGEHPEHEVVGIRPIPKAAQFVFLVILSNAQATGKQMRDRETLCQVARMPSCIVPPCKLWTRRVARVASRGEEVVAPTLRTTRSPKASDQRYQLGDERRSLLGCLRGREFVKGPMDHRHCFHVLVVNLFCHLG